MLSHRAAGAGHEDHCGPGHFEHLIGSSLGDVTLASASGSPIRLRGYQGRPLVLLFWSPSYPGHERDWAAFRAFRDQVRLAHIEVLPISLEGAGATRRFLKGEPWEGPVALDPDLALADRIGPFGLPLGVLLDGQQRVKGVSETADLLEIRRGLWNDRWPQARISGEPSESDRETPPSGPPAGDDDRARRPPRPSQMALWASARGRALWAPAARSLWETEGVRLETTPEGLRLTALAPVGRAFFRRTQGVWNTRLVLEARLLRGVDFGLGQARGTPEPGGFWKLNGWDMGAVPLRLLKVMADHHWPARSTDLAWHRWRVSGYPTRYSAHRYSSPRPLYASRREPGPLGMVLVGQGTQVEVRFLELRGERAAETGRSSAGAASAQRRAHERFRDQT